MFRRNSNTDGKWSNNIHVDRRTERQPSHNASTDRNDNIHGNRNIEWLQQDSSSDGNSDTIAERDGKLTDDLCRSDSNTDSIRRNDFHVDRWVIRQSGDDPFLNWDDDLYRNRHNGLLQ